MNSDQFEPGVHTVVAQRVIAFQLKVDRPEVLEKNLTLQRLRQDLGQSIYGMYRVKDEAPLGHLLLDPQVRQYEIPPAADGAQALPSSFCPRSISIERMHRVSLAPWPKA